MKYALILIACLAAGPANAEAYCNPDVTMFYDGQKLAFNSEICEVTRISEKDIRSIGGDAALRPAMFLCPEIGFEGFVYADGQTLTMVTNKGQASINRCD
jgi:hypothetical protein